MKNILLIICVSFFSSSIFASKLYPISALEKGRWDFSGDKKSVACSKYHHTFSFSDDGKVMTLNEFENQLNIEKAVYDIAVKGAVIRSKLRTEFRKDASGKLVGWDLIMKNEKEYCWRRSDWDASECTKSVIRCD